MDENLMVGNPRALLITDVTGPGGVGTHLGQLASIAHRQGWDVLVLMDSTPDTDVMANSLRQLSVPIIRKGLYRGFNDDEVIRKSVLNVFKTFKPDIVHVHCGSPRSAIIPRELTIKNNLPLIITEHFVPNNLEITEENLKRIREIYKHAFAAIVVCKENLKLLRINFQLFAKQQFIIRYGVDSSEEYRNFPATTIFKAVTVARLSPRKGIDVLIKAVNILPIEVRSRLLFTLVGDGEDKGQLKQMVSDYNLQKYIKFAGWSNDVQSILCSQDLFILPSLSEGQPIALLEALAVGLPCIASAVSGIPEVLRNNTYGILVKPNDPISLAKAIIRFIKEPLLYQQKAKKAQSYIQENHNPEKNIGQVINLWKSAMKFSNL